MKPINLKNVDSKASIIKIESHPAERKNSSVTVGSVCCSTCCCCCCCLHSAGGIVGAAIMSRNVLKSQPTVLANQTPYQAMSPYQKQTYPATQNQAPNYEELLKEHKSSIKTALQIYWLLLVPTIFLPALLGEVAFLLTLIALPIAQMGLSAFVIILINILPIADRKAATNAMLKILAGAFVGSIIGLFLLSIFGIVLTF
jgi:hypothetical protein